MHYYTVQFKFDAQDSTELSVVKGDVVRTEKFVDEDGWVKVELASNPRKRGFVPVSFLRESKDPLDPGASAESFRSTSPPPAASYTAAALNLGNAVRETTIRKDADVDSARGPGLIPSSGVPNPAAVVEGFMKNEIYYKQLMKQRQDAMQKIESALAEATSELVVCRDKNGQLTRRLRELEAAMQRERSKWKERVDEERLLIAQRSKEPLAAITTTTTTTSHSARIPRY